MPFLCSPSHLLSRSLCRSAVAALAVTSLAALVHSSAAQDKGSDPEVWRGGAFDVPRVKLDPSQLPQVEPPKLGAAWFKRAQFDKQGRSDAVVVTLNYDDSELRAHAIAGAGLVRDAAHHEIERSVVDLLDGRTPGDSHKVASADIAQAREALITLFHGPDGARFVIAQSRLPDERRISGKTEDPRELLERYVVLRYATPEAAEAAMRSLLKRGAVATAVQDVEMHLSAAPTDFYYAPPENLFPLPMTYQWGLHAMNFAGAWERTNGHAYVGVVDAPPWHDPGWTEPYTLAVITALRILLTETTWREFSLHPSRLTSTRTCPITSVSTLRLLRPGALYVDGGHLAMP